jgi:hypothetical protein
MDGPSCPWKTARRISFKRSRMSCSRMSRRSGRRFAVEDMRQRVNPGARPESTGTGRAPRRSSAAKMERPIDWISLAIAASPKASRLPLFRAAAVIRDAFRSLPHGFLRQSHPSRSDRPAKPSRRRTRTTRFDRHRRAAFACASGCSLAPRLGGTQERIGHIGLLVSRIAAGPLIDFRTRQHETVVMTNVGVRTKQLRREGGRAMPPHF